MANILVVDDEDNIRNMITTMLNEKGHAVSQTQDPLQAHGIMAKEQIELLITDLVMPGKTGIDLIMELTEQFPELKIIAISGGGGINGRFDYLPIAKLIGANNIMRKPFKLTELNLAVDSLLVG